MKDNNKGFSVDVIRSVLYAVISAMLLIILFSIIVKAAELDDGIKPVTQIIKALSIFIGLFMGIKYKSGGIKKGFFTGLFFTAISTVLFSIFSHQPVFVVSNYIDLAVFTAVGAVCGAIVLVIKSWNTR